MIRKEEFNSLIKKTWVQGNCRSYEYWFALDQIQQRVYTSDSILDLGTHKSGFPAILVKAGYTNVVASDIDIKYKKYHKRYYDNLGVEYDYIQFNAGKDKCMPVDVITAISAIEHFHPYIKDAVYNIKDLLKDKGLFIVTVPYAEFYQPNRYLGKDHPPERVFDDNAFYTQIAKHFKELHREYWIWNKDRTNVLEGKASGKDIGGLMAVLEKND